MQTPPRLSRLTTNYRASCEQGSVVGEEGQDDAEAAARRERQASAAHSVRTAKATRRHRGELRVESGKPSPGRAGGGAARPLEALAVVVELEQVADELASHAVEDGSRKLR